MFAQQALCQVGHNLSPWAVLIFYCAPGCGKGDSSSKRGGNSPDVAPL